MVKRRITTRTFKKWEKFARSLKKRKIAKPVEPTLADWIKKMRSSG